MALETHVFTSPALTIGASELTYSPTSATLVTGDRDAVLIDTQFIVREVAALGDMIEQTGYIRDFRAALSTSTEANQIVTALSAKYPEYGNIATLIVSARAHLLADGEELLPSVAAA